MLIESLNSKSYFPKRRPELTLSFGTPQKGVGSEKKKKRRKKEGKKESKEGWKEERRKERRKQEKRKSKKEKSKLTGYDGGGVLW